MQKNWLHIFCALTLAACTGAPSTQTSSVPASTAQSSVISLSSVPRVSSAAAVSSVVVSSSKSSVSSVKTSSSLASSAAAQSSTPSSSASSQPMASNCEGEVMLGEDLYDSLICSACHGAVPTDGKTIWKGGVAKTVGIDLYDSQRNGFKPSDSDSLTPVNLDLITFISQYMPSKDSPVSKLQAERIVAYLTHTAGNPKTPWCPGTPWPHASHSSLASSSSAMSSSSAGASSSAGTVTFKQKYNTLCSGCHGADGQGVASVGPEILHPTADYTVWLVRNGRKHPQYNLAMPAYTQNQLSDNELNQIIDWLSAAPKPTTGEGLYRDYCYHCHEDNGRGTAGHNAKGRTVSQLTTNIRNGHNLSNFGTRNKYMPKWNVNELTTSDIQKIQTYAK